MKTKDLRDFISIYKMAEVDTGTETLAFEQHGDELSVSFEGLHVGAVRKSTEIDIGLADGEVLAASWSVLTGALALLDSDAPLKVAHKGTSLLLSGGSRKATVRLSSDLAPFAFERSPDPSVVIDLDTLPAFVTLLSSVAAHTIDKPVLTGINLSVPKKGSLLLRATDGSRAFAAMIPAVKAETDFAITLQSGDLTTAFAVLDGQIGLSLQSGVAVLQDEQTVLRIAGLFGDYPSFNSLPRKDFAYSFDLPAEAIKLAQRAAALLDSNRLISISAVKGNLRIFVEGEIVGGFSMDLGKSSLPDFQIAFDADYLSVAADIAPTVTVSVSAELRPALVQGGKGRFYWISQTVVA